ncbi:hypothetical protein Fbal_1729 [Ferrimonas balearica DSM 9799]|uniref:Uncharacterized protein n=1 Tax=Ferrimonas balearica (strain DSM 9799 / CCM 4581 / KCTC 23876 / PAT) TaxID=550540 RepID=E1SRI2_FERBD|nr:hypothetical protein [Ferrimonas balearica]ADN75933.1 hypothetical protein Fbal_1729 [Ferrimonas balearica DSM 9799]MBY5979617.1 DNA-binding protein [Ferrimonas balearica]MBY6223515.1 DNA-binding protein [Ferrimonas balearica]
MARTQTYEHDEAGNCILTVSAASQKGGMAQVVGGHLFRRYLEGDRHFIIRLPGNIGLTTMEVISGALLGLNAKITLEGDGAARVEEYLREQHDHQL